MLDPWEHVVGMGLGAVFANQLVKWDVKLKEDLEVMLNKARAANERRYFGMSSSLFFCSISLILLWVSTKSLFLMILAYEMTNTAIGLLAMKLRLHHFVFVICVFLFSSKV